MWARKTTLGSGAYSLYATDQLANDDFSAGTSSTARINVAAAAPVW